MEGGEDCFENPDWRTSYAGKSTSGSADLRLDIVRADGALRFLQHFPDFKRIGVLKPEEVSRLFPRLGGFTSGAIRGHFRNETRRRR
jgi:hypothetical protein